MTLVGDAAHTMHQSGGQGGNQNFEDAAVLSRFLTQAVKDAEKGKKVTAREPLRRLFESLKRFARMKRIHEAHLCEYERKIAEKTSEHFQKSRKKASERYSSKGGQVELSVN